MTISEVIILIILLFFLAGLPLLGMFFSIRAHDKAIIKRDRLLKENFGEDIKIYRSFPIPQEIEEVVQGGLRGIIQQFRELIITDSWIFIQPTHRGVGKITTAEDRNAASLSLFAHELTNVSPTFLIRNQQNKSLLSRYYQVQIERKQFVRSELDFDGRQSLYTEQGMHIHALQVMSPELLLSLSNAPCNADIVIRKNQLYYILPGEQAIENTATQLFQHSVSVSRELEDNLARWARSESNRKEVKKINEMDLAVTLNEAWKKSQK